MMGIVYLCKSICICIKYNTIGMEHKQLKRLPVGIQTFSNIIDGDMLYIDKTEYIWNMIHLSKYIFLSRLSIRSAAPSPTGLYANSSLA